MPYTVVDRDGRTAESAITVIVDYPLNNPPAANPDTFTIFREEMLNVLANDTDIEGGALGSSPSPNRRAADRSRKSASRFVSHRPPDRVHHLPSRTPSVTPACRGRTPSAS